jgi:hypothetical protein
MKHFYCVFFILSILIAQPAGAVNNDSLKKAHIILLPAIFSSPEVGLAVGAASAISFKTSDPNDALTRASSIQLLGIYTTKGQNTEAVDATIYFPKEHFIYFNEISHSYFPDKFWGLGPNTKDDSKDSYTYEQFYFFPRLSRKLRKNLFAGLLYEYQNVFKVDYKKGGTFDSTSFYGKSRYQVSGLGFSVTYDSRNVSFSPSKGFLIESLVDGFNRSIGSNYNFVKWTVDIRSFFKLVRNTVLATQLYNYSTFGKTPLRDQAMLGGASNMRGIYDGRFRDYNSISLIMELRIPVYKRFSICTFGDVGNVYKKGRDLNSPLKYSYGGGLRIALLKKEKINLRLDYGYYSKKNQGFYLNIGECF